MLVVLVCLVAAIGVVIFACFLLFELACARSGGLLGKYLPSIIHQDGTPIDAYRDVIERGTRWHSAKKWEDVWITSHDGLRLHGFYLEHPAAKRAILGVHGYRSGAVRDFSGAMEDLYNAGCSLLLIEQRAHGQSEGKYISFGALERYDVQAWANELHRRTAGAMPIYLDGVSMGAATVLMAGELEMPESLAGVIADCGYTTPREELTHVVANMLHANPFPAVPVVLRMAKTVGRFDLDAASATRGAAGWKVPVLFAHGTSDTFVPSWMGEENFMTCNAPKDILLVDGAEHGLSYLVNPQTYKTKLSHLFRAAEEARQTA